MIFGRCGCDDTYTNLMLAPTLFSLEAFPLHFVNLYHLQCMLHLHGNSPSRAYPVILPTRAVGRRLVFFRYIRGAWLWAAQPNRKHGQATAKPPCL